MKNFRLLKADEIDCRISMVKKNGLSLLLYKDARCDMNILDETVGPFNWQKAYSRDNRNCTVSIWDQEKGQWISKEDTGTESYTEAEKGLASDSFKRACFNWGIGRELYTAPFIWVSSTQCEIKQSGTKYTCYDRFKVTGIGYDENERINSLEITKVNYQGRPVGVVYKFDGDKAKENEKKDAETKRAVEGDLDKKIDPKKAAIVEKCLSSQPPAWRESILKHYNIEKLSDLTGRQYADLNNRLIQMQEEAKKRAKESKTA